MEATTPTVPWTRQCANCAKHAYPYCPAGHKVAWSYDWKTDTHTAQLGRVQLTVSSGAVYPSNDEGRQVMTATVDGLELVARRVLDTHDRGAAQMVATDYTLAAMKAARLEC
jgi:hypothetical protein